MALVALKNIIRPSQTQLLPILSRFCSLYEPDYLKTLLPKIPLYPSLNVQIKGYDYPIVEKFQGFVQKFVDKMDMETDASWAMPPKQFNIKRYKARSDKVEADYKLNIYERNVQISNVSSSSLPIFVRILEASVPPGITFVVENYDSSKELRRYVPDTDLLSLKSELDEVIKKKD